MRVRETQIPVFNFTRNSNKSGDSIELLRALAGKAGARESAVLVTLLCYDCYHSAPVTGGQSYNTELQTFLFLKS